MSKMSNNATPDEKIIEDDEDAASGGGGKIVWIVLGLIAAAALAVFGGMMLGEFAGLSQGDVEEVAPRPTPVASQTAPEPLPIETDFSTPLDGQPELDIATTLAPNSGVQPIDVSEWLRQEDFPRDLFRGVEVRGIVAVYLTVIPDGSVTRCTIGNSSEVEPQRFLRPAAVGVCRALRERARFEPYVVAPAPTPTPVPAPTAIAPKEQTTPGIAIEPAKEPVAPIATPVSSREVFVRIAFRTTEVEAVDRASD